jgi:hypothetical protein
MSFVLVWWKQICLMDDVCEAELLLGFCLIIGQDTPSWQDDMYILWCKGDEEANKLVGRHYKL